MAAKITQVQYFNATVRDRPGEGYRILSGLAGAGVNLLAFSAIPIGPQATQLVLFPEDAHLFNTVVEQLGVQCTGPERAILIQDDDELGLLARIHQKLSKAEVNVYASSGVSDGRGGFGYVLYVRATEFEDAVRALGI